MAGDNAKMVAQFSSDRTLCSLQEDCFAIRDKEIYDKACSDNSNSCLNRIENNPVSEEDYQNGAYVIEVAKMRDAFALSGGKGD